MVSLEPVQPATSRVTEPSSSPRISFSADFLDDEELISISPSSQEDTEKEKNHEKARHADFEFLSNSVSSHTMLTADELFSEGKLFPFWQKQQADKLSKISLKSKEAEDVEEVVELTKEESRVNWFVDDDPSPRPPNCTVLWKELLKLRKQRTSSLSPSSSSSSSSSSSNNLADAAATEEKKGRSEDEEKHVKRTKKGLERSRSNSIKIRPMINVPICTQVKSSSLPPLFPNRKARTER